MNCWGRGAVDGSDVNEECFLSENGGEGEEAPAVSVHDPSPSSASFAATDGWPTLMLRGQADTVGMQSGVVKEAASFASAAGSKESFSAVAEAGARLTPLSMSAAAETAEVQYEDDRELGPAAQIAGGESGKASESVSASASVRQASGVDSTVTVRRQAGSEVNGYHLLAANSGGGCEATETAAADCSPTLPPPPLPQAVCESPPELSSKRRGNASATGRGQSGPSVSSVQGQTDLIKSNQPRCKRASIRRILACGHGKDTTGLSCMNCSTPFCAQCWLVPDLWMRNNISFVSLTLCPCCDNDYDVKRNKGLRCMAEMIEARIDRGQTADSEFKSLCDEFIQVLVDGPSAGDFEVQDTFQSFALKVLSKFAEGRLPWEPPINIWSALLFPSLSSEMILKLGQAYDACCGSQVAVFPPKELNRLIEYNSAILRVAIVFFEGRSSHPTMLLGLGVWEAMNKMPHVEISVFDLTPAPLDRKLHRRLQDGFGSRFHYMGGAKAGKVRKAIQNQNAAIVLLIGYHQEGCQLAQEVARLRPAPLHVQSLAHAGTSATKYVDVLVADQNTVLNQHRANYSEKTVARFPGGNRGMSYLPAGFSTDHRGLHTAWPSESFQLAIRRRENLPEKGLLIGCVSKFNRFTKPFLIFCCRVLQGSQNSSLVMLSESKTADMRVRRFFEESGCGDRLVFMQPIINDEKRFLEFCGVVGFHLSPWLYNFHTLGLFILFSGSFFLCLGGGNNHASRTGASLLLAHGASQFIHTDEGALLDHALLLSNNRGELLQARQTVLSLRDKSPLFNSEGYAMELTTLLRKVWMSKVGSRTAPGAVTDPSQQEMPQFVDITEDDVRRNAQHMQLVSFVQALQPTEKRLPDALIRSIEKTVGLAQQRESRRLTAAGATQQIQMLQLAGLRNFEVLQKGRYFLLIVARLGGTEVVCKISLDPRDRNEEEWDPYTSIEANPPSPHGREARFQQVAAKTPWFIVAPEPVSFNQNALHANFFRLPTTGTSAAIVHDIHIVSRLYLEMAEVFADLAAKVLEDPCNPPTDEITELLYQILKLYSWFHEQTYALVAHPSKLMLLPNPDGFGRSAKARIIFRGRPYAIVVACGADVEKVPWTTGRSNDPRLQDLQLLGCTFLDILNGRYSRTASLPSDFELSRREGLLAFQGLYAAVPAEELALMLGVLCPANISIGQDLVEHLILQSAGVAASLAWLPFPSDVKRLLHACCSLITRKDSRGKECWATNMIKSSMFDKQLNAEPDKPEWSGSSCWTDPSPDRPLAQQERHYFVKGFQHDVGLGETLKVLSVWLVVLGKRKQPTIRMHGQGSPGDCVAILACPVYDLESQHAQYLQVDKTNFLPIPMCKRLVFNKMDCGEFGLRIACETGRVGCYIQSVQKSKPSNCTCISPYQQGGPGSQLQVSDLVARPWLAIVAFKLTETVEAYAELTYVREEERKRENADGTQGRTNKRSRAEAGLASFD